MRRHARRLRLVAPLLLLAVTACSTARPFPWGSMEPRDPGGSRPAVQLIAHADDLARRVAAPAEREDDKFALRFNPAAANSY